MTRPIELSDNAKREALKLPAGASLIAYFEEHRPVGRWLAALLANDLIHAIAGADDINRLLIVEYVRWLVRYPPGFSSGVWGSPEAVKAWAPGSG